MRHFILGIVAVLLVLGLGGLVIAQFGLMPTNADSNPPALERRVATYAIDAALGRRASRLSNPVPSNDGNLIDGMKIYTMNCAVCHGALDSQRSPLEHSFYPPAPQFVLEPIDNPEWHIYDVVRNGIRYTGMPFVESLADCARDVEGDGLRLTDRNLASGRAGILEPVLWGTSAGHRGEAQPTSMKRDWTDSALPHMPEFS